MSPDPDGRSPVIRDCTRIGVDDDTVEHDELDGVLIREGELEGRPLQLEGSQYVYAEDLPWDELDERNRVHDSGTVTYYR